MEYQKYRSSVEKLSQAYVKNSIKEYNAFSSLLSNIFTGKDELFEKATEFRKILAQQNKSNLGFYDSMFSIGLEYTADITDELFPLKEAKTPSKKPNSKTV